MKITETKSVTKDETKVVSVICDRCGESCRAPRENANDTSVTIKARGCYDSDFPPDMQTWEFDVCEHCLATWVAQLKTPPRVRGYQLTNNEETWVDSATPELQFLMHADPSECIDSKRTEPQYLRKVMEKLRLEPRPLVRAAMEGSTLEDLRSRQPKPPPEPDRSFAISFTYGGKGVYRYKAEQTHGELIPGDAGTAEAYKLILKTYPHADGCALAQVIDGHPSKHVYGVPVRTWEFERLDVALRNIEAESEKWENAWSEALISSDHMRQRVDVKS